MKITKLMILLAMLGVMLGGGYYFWHKADSKTSLKIENFDYDQDHQAVDDLFHKGDNFYWMVYDGGVNSTYSVDFMLRYKTPHRHEKLSIMILKVAKVDGKLAGFLAYYPKSAHIWHLLFLMVDQDFRRQGLAKKMLNYGVDDMLARGAVRVDLGTRDNNFKAQNLYTNFGFRFTHSDEGFVHYTWHKP